VKALEHGGNLKKFARRFQIQEKDILDFSSNITPLGLPDSVKKLYPQLLDRLTTYPDPSASELRAEVARLYPLFPENILAGNGSMDLLALIVRTIAPKRALLVEPSFLEYRRLLHLQGAQIKSVSLKEGNQFQFPYKEIFGALPNTDLVILCHPNNPTGSALKREELLELLSECRRRNIFVVVDEAFADWTPELSVAREIKDNSFFAVVRSLTKFYGLAGIRAGYAVGSRRLMETLGAHQDPWSMNAVSQALSIEALRDKDFQEESLEWYQAESAWFLSAFQAVEGIKVFPSFANFFLIKIMIPQMSAENLFQFCGEKGVYIRLLRDFPGLGDPYFRVGLRRRKDNETLLRIFQEWASLHKNAFYAEEHRRV
jgi:threonine-phosphate decarboxylase